MIKMMIAYIQKLIASFNITNKKLVQVDLLNLRTRLYFMNTLFNQ